MGVITPGPDRLRARAASAPPPPFWVIVACAVAIALGTYLGGWRIIRTLGKGLVEIESPQGMAAESSSAAVILASSHFGLVAVDDARRDRLDPRHRHRQALVPSLRWGLGRPRWRRPGVLSCPLLQPRRAHVPGRRRSADGSPSSRSTSVPPWPGPTWTLGEPRRRNGSGPGLVHQPDPGARGRCRGCPTTSARTSPGEDPARPGLPRSSAAAACARLAARRRVATAVEPHLADTPERRGPRCLHRGRVHAGDSVLSDRSGSRGGPEGQAIGSSLQIAVGLAASGYDGVTADRTSCRADARLPWAGWTSTVTNAVSPRRGRAVAVPTTHGARAAPTDSGAARPPGPQRARRGPARRAHHQRARGGPDLGDRGRAWVGVSHGHLGHATR